MQRKTKRKGNRKYYVAGFILSLTMLMLFIYAGEASKPKIEQNILDDAWLSLRDATNPIRQWGEEQFGAAQWNIYIMIGVMLFAALTILFFLFMLDGPSRSESETFKYY